MSYLENSIGLTQIRHFSFSEDSFFNQKKIKILSVKKGCFIPLNNPTTSFFVAILSLF
jgi:hypothetical protein